MALQIILILVIFPILLGYLISATQFWKNRCDILFYRLLQFINYVQQLRFLPQQIWNEIGIRREIIRSNKYFDTQYEDDRRKTRAGIHAGSTEALARILQVTDHQRPPDHYWGSVTKKRPPMWIRYIIAQIVRW